MCEQVIKEVQSASCFSVMIDETTDIRTTSQMVVYVKYILNAAPTTRFLGIVEVTPKSVVN